MKLFTNSVYEKMMRQVPRPSKSIIASPAPKGHFCYGCKRYGEHCVHPCYRDAKIKIRKGVIICNL